MEQIIHYYITYEPRDMVIWGAEAGWERQAVEFESSFSAQKAIIIAGRHPEIYNLPKDFNPLELRTIPSTSRLYYKIQQGVVFGWQIRKDGVADLLDSVIEELDLSKK